MKSITIRKKNSFLSSVYPLQNYIPVMVKLYREVTPPSQILLPYVGIDQCFLGSSTILPLVHVGITSYERNLRTGTR